MIRNRKMVEKNGKEEKEKMEEKIEIYIGGRGKSHVIV